MIFKPQGDGSAVLPRLSVIVMAFNEANSLEIVVKEIVSELRELQQPYEVIIVDDGSLDGTEIIADRLAKKLESIRVIHHETNQGLGDVYRTGFKHARGNFVTFFPADGQMPANNIKQFVNLIDNMDMVLGYVPKRKSSLLARSLSCAERILYRLLFGRFPKFQGVFMVRRTLLDELELKSTGRGWAVVMELVIRASRGGYRLMSVPTKARPRMSGESKVNNFHTIWANLKQTFALRYYL